MAELGKLLERDAQKVQDTLLQVVENEDEASPEVRRRAIEALAPMNTERVRDIILETYESTSETVRASAIYAMGQNGDPQWVPYILEEMESDEDQIRYEAAGAFAIASSPTALSGARCRSRMLGRIARRSCSAMMGHRS